MDVKHIEFLFGRLKADLESARADYDLDRHKKAGYWLERLASTANTLRWEVEKIPSVNNNTATGAQL